MGRKVLLAEVATGIIMNVDGQSLYLTGGELPYIHFESLTQAITFATAFVGINSTVEAAVWDEAGNYQQTIIGKTS
jgi:hypothetical protein